MSLHDSTFGYLKPTEKQLFIMEEAREAAKRYADTLQRLIPDGPDKTYTIRKLREVAMWANIAITREQNGGPRE
jgi:hypothetical protein